MPLEPPVWAGAVVRPAGTTVAGAYPLGLYACTRVGDASLPAIVSLVNRLGWTCSAATG